jgi:hypothetical protein
VPRVKLADLDASFVETDGRRVGVQFCCPACRRERILVPFALPPSGDARELNVHGVVWQRTGDTLETLTLSPSVNFRHVYGGLGSDSSEPRTECTWHGWVRDGQAVSA